MAMREEEPNEKSRNIHNKGFENKVKDAICNDNKYNNSCSMLEYKTKLKSRPIYICIYAI